MRLAVRQLAAAQITRWQMAPDTNTSSANITIASIVVDALVEGAESVFVSLSNPSGATLGSDTVHSYTITDNDAATVDFNVTSSSGAGQCRVRLW